MSLRPKKKKEKKEEDWIYDPIVVKGIIRAKHELDESLKKGEYMPTLEEVVEEFQKRDAKRVRD